MKYKKLAALIMAGGVLLSAGMLTGGCGSSQGQPKQQQAMQVTTINPFESDTPIMREYTGSVMALQEVPVSSQVSGTVMEKYIEGGEKVTQGQPLFKIDTRTYAANLAAAQATAAQAAANYENARRDLSRYEQLIASGAISKQTYDTQQAAVEAYRGVWDAAKAQVDLASTNLDDTVVTAPFDGTLSMNDVNIGTYASAGSTALVTISSADPIYVQFDMSENEYLSLTKDSGGTEALGDHLKLRLSDGSIYEETGKIVQINPSLTGGQLTLKAAFPNPNGLLVPGMFAAVVSDAQIAANSILIPTKALVQLLNKDMVDVVVDGKMAQKAVKVGPTYGIYTVIESGLTPDDVVIVEGQGKLQVGQAVEAKGTTREELEKAAAEALNFQGGNSGRGK
jgi:membrane fusion protein (multidrug efflux system)